MLEETSVNWDSLPSGQTRSRISGASGQRAFAWGFRFIDEWADEGALVVFSMQRTASSGVRVLCLTAKTVSQLLVQIRSSWPDTEL